MRKRLIDKNLNERKTGRTFLALSLATSLAAFGCTTNRTPGNGEPIRSGPGVGPAAPTSGVTSGSSSGGNTTGYRPMMSSSAHMDPLPTVTTRAKQLPLSPDEAAAVMADNVLGRGVRVLGPASPGSSGRVYQSDRTVVQQQQLPMQTLNPIITVNSSINSVAHVPALSGGADGGGVAITGTVGGITGASTITGTGVTTGTATGAIAGTGFTSGVTAPSAGATGAVTATSSAATPTAAALPVTVGTAGTTTAALTPTVTTSTVPTPTPSSSGAFVATTTPAVASTTGTTRTAATTSGTATASGTATVNNTTAVASGTNLGTATAAVTVSRSIRVTQDANGKVVVSNTGNSQKQ